MSEYIIHGAYGNGRLEAKSGPRLPETPGLDRGPLTKATFQESHDTLKETDMTVGNDHVTAMFNSYVKLPEDTYCWSAKMLNRGD